MNNSDLEKSILKTIAYFDIFQYPLTSLEVYKWLFLPEKNYTFIETLKTLDNLVLADQIQKKFGFYFLPQQSQNVKIRLERYYLAEKKFKIALFVIARLGWFSNIKNISICNNVGYNNAQAQSDIDFFIIIRAGHLWFSRLLITLITSILMLRRHAKEIANRACLSFYLADDHYDISDIALNPPDIYLIYWLATLAPVYDQDSYLDFLKANDWQKKYLPNFYPVKMSCRRRYVHSQNQFFKKINFKLFTFKTGGWLEKTSKILQRQKMKGHFHSGHTGTEVVITDSMLKFHENDRRRQYYQTWQAKLKDLNLI